MTATEPFAPIEPLTSTEPQSSAQANIRSRTTPWAWVSLGCGAATSLVWTLDQATLAQPNSESEGLQQLLRILVTLLAWYLGITAVVSHYLARRRIQVSESSGELVEGDFTALLGLLLAVGGLLLWNQVFGPLRFIVALIAVALNQTSEVVKQWADASDSLAQLLIIPSTLLYAAISGPPAMRRLLAIGMIVIFSLGIVAPCLLRSRENQRVNTVQERSGQVGRSLIQLMDEHRGQFPK